MGMFRIRLEDLRFFSRIGVFDQERIVGNEFAVDVEVELDADSFESENLDTTVSYADIYDKISVNMKGEWLLLESVAKRIADDICNSWAQARRCCVKITKLSVPVSGIQGKSSVEYIKD